MDLQTKMFFYKIRVIKMKRKIKHLFDPVQKVLGSSVTAIQRSANPVKFNNEANFKKFLPY